MKTEFRQERCGQRRDVRDHTLGRHSAKSLGSSAEGFFASADAFGNRPALSKVNSEHAPVLRFQGATMTTDQRVLKLRAGGYTPIQIAERLGITVSHVKLILSSTKENHIEPIQFPCVSKCTPATEGISIYRPEAVVFGAAA